MSQEIIDAVFNDGTMLTTCIVTFGLMFSILLVLIHWRDYNALWCGAVCIGILLCAIAYQIQWVSHSSTAVPFPFVTRTLRPGLFIICVVMVLYSLGRLREKHLYRQSQKLP